MYSEDEKLVAQTLSGDRDAFGVLVHKYQEMVYAYAFQKVKNVEDAQDITQEVFLRAYRHLNKLRQPHQFRSWLYTIMSNECNRWLVRVTTKRQRETALEDATEDDLRIEPKHTAPTEGWQVDLEQAISELSDDNRVAVSMFYMSNCSLKEISEFLGVSVNAVKVKLHRARQQLGNTLSEQYDQFVKSHKLKGGFLMQVMNQIGHTPAPTMTFTWNSTVVAKLLFSLITAFCILIGSIAVQHDSTVELPMNRIKVGGTAIDRGTPLEVSLLPPIPSGTDTSLSVVPVQTESSPPGVAAGTSSQPGTLLADQGAGNAPPKFPAAAEVEDEKLKLSGRVVNKDGVPVADAAILYVVESNLSESVTRTAVDGTFRFDLPRPELKQWKQVSIVATHSDYAFGWQTFSIENTTDVEIQLASPGSISGKIMNEAGEPIQNAEVQVQYIFSSHSTSGIPERNSGLDTIPIEPAKTDANGEFALHGLPEGARVNLSIRRSGYAKRASTIPVGTDGLEFRLKREGRVEGNLSYTGTGAPVANATVALQGIGTTYGWGKASTDTKGNYLLKNLAPGTYNLFLYEGPEGWTAVAKESIKVVEGQPLADVDLTLV